MSITQEAGVENFSAQAQSEIFSVENTKGMIFSKAADEKPFGLSFMEAAPENGNQDPSTAPRQAATYGVNATNKPGGGTAMDAYVDF